jgi:hypothetical protein
MYLHATALTPDPTYGQRRAEVGRNHTTMTLYPHRAVRMSPHGKQEREWARDLDIFTRPRALTVRPGSNGRFELLVDFGTELEAELHIDVLARERTVLCVFFGESEYEADGLAMHSRVPDVPPAIEHFTLNGHGTRTIAAAPRGFRFVKIVVPDVRTGMRITGISARARFEGGMRLGDFSCSDRLLQQVWQTSLYTARLCTRPDGYWDGIKRDRMGWYNDARICQLAVDTAFDLPRQALTMVSKLPADRWVNEIPICSFDAVATLKQSILRYGTGTDGVRECYSRVRSMLAWVEKTHGGRDGLLRLNEEYSYFFGIGFLDWSPMPVGGRFEELCWLQCRYIEALANAAEIAAWLRRPADAARFAEKAKRLRALVKRRFWDLRKGFVHTLNRTQEAWDKLSPGRHYRDTYRRRIRLGPSGPSRHSSALAAWAGLCETPETKRKVRAALNSGSVPPVITPFFAYYEQSARAMCGDPQGALLAMRDYVGQQIRENDGATVWESFEPEVQGFERWALHAWPKSLCHGWGSGIVPLTTRYLLGVRPTAPGFSELSIDPPCGLECSFDATIPTPRGAVRITRDRKRGAVVCRVPRALSLARPLAAGIRIEQVT